MPTRAEPDLATPAQAADTTHAPAHAAPHAAAGIPTPAAITPALLKTHSITADEYARIEKLMGRTPSLTELGIFSVMWSEHCSYKSSRVHLKRLPTRGTRTEGPGSVVQGPGENAGIIDVGDGWACAFKIESHNHPSYIEPYQGAATGVGGILRDIFTMNARPLAVMDSLRFGPLQGTGNREQGTENRKQGTERQRTGKREQKSTSGLVASESGTQNETAGQSATGTTPPAVPCSLFPVPSEIDYARNRHTFSGVVAGIAGYGNCFGVPNLGGETRFEACYSGNPLVNAFALGLVRKDEIFYAKATGVGNPVIYVGAKTGRDGIHGATMASEEFTEGSEQKRPNVQMGDPFMEKLLLEACLEAMSLKPGAVLGIQDMGAAGLTCSTCEMGARGELGVSIELDKVPQRETGMTSYEIMLSESQERMLLVAEKGREGEVQAVFAKWGLDASIVGVVTADDVMRVTHHGELMAEIPNKALTDDAPVYRSIIGQRLVGNLRHQLAVVGHAHHIVRRHHAHNRRVQPPLREHRLHLALAPLLGHQQHPLLGLGQHNFVAGHAGLALRHLVQLDRHAQLAARAHLAGGAGQPRRAHVLDAEHRAGLQTHRLQAGLQQQLLHKRVAHLHVRPLLLAALGKLLAGHSRAVDAIAPRLRAHVDHRVAHAGRLRVEDLVLPHQAQRKRIHQRIAAVARFEPRLPAQVGHAKAVPISGDPRDDAGERMPVPRVVDLRGNREQGTGNSGRSCAGRRLSGGLVLRSAF